MFTVDSDGIFYIHKDLIHQNIESYRVYISASNGYKWSEDLDTYLLDITISLADPIALSSFENRPPVFLDELTLITVDITDESSDVTFYPLPEIWDPNGDPYTIAIRDQPEYLWVDESSKMIIFVKSEIDESIYNTN